MFQSIKNWLYDIIVASGITNYILPLIFPLTVLLRDKNYYNYEIVDEAGATMKAVKLNGRLYTAIMGVNKVPSDKKLKIRKDDVMLCGYPKTGCHWVNEIIHMLATGKAELTKHGKILEGMIDLLPHIVLDSLPSPRVLNTHYWYEDLPEQIKARKTKIVWTVRSPKDVVVSYFNHVQSLNYVYCYEGTFQNFYKLFLAGELEYGSYLDFTLNWEKVIKSQTDNPILVVEFENLKRDTVGTVKEIARFLNIDITDEFAAEIVEESRLDNMKKKQPKNKLLNTGKVGNWKTWLSEEQSQEMEKWWKDSGAYPGVL